MERIKVAVSPFFGGENWTDELTSITFEKNPRGLNIYSIPTSLDLTNIKKAIRLNALILAEGNLEEFNEVEQIVVEAPQAEMPAEEPKQPEKEEAVKEEPVKQEEEPVVEAQSVKPAARKRSTPRKTANK